MEERTNRGVFSGRLGYVLATAGSAVGLGNIWRFPYLAAKYGGGIFILIYLLLALTFGYTMMVSETSLGRITGKSPVGAFRTFGKGRLLSAGGWINAVIPMLILPYYSVIGGWVCKYLYTYIRGGSFTAAQDGFFGTFMTSASASEIWFLVFAAATLLVIVFGVKSGVERVSTVMMPGLVLLSIAVAVYSITRPGALAGVRYLLVPDFKHFTWMTVVAALGQMFYSLSIAMGILITYGSYMKKDVDVEKSMHSVIFFDSGIALLAGLMIIPAVFAFSGGDPSALNAGPSLMFITMPKVFESMGFGNVVGFVFFLAVLLAALTSSISLAETSVSTFEDELGWSRGKATAVVAAITVVLGSLSSLGYSTLSSVRPFGMEILDFFDFVTNSLMMPVAAFAVCMLVIRKIGTEKIAAEVRLSSKFRAEKMYRLFVRVIAPIFIAVILISSILNVLGVIKI
ncbi:MAG: sodium-dependent transporter [Oscillospiraceae bacterium]|nr:sodium-dependent transporter [Oscillospiraceae bacterium]